MIGTSEREFIEALTEMMDGQLANIQMKKQRISDLVFKFIFCSAESLLNRMCESRGIRR